MDQQASERRLSSKDTADESSTDQSPLDQDEKAGDRVDTDGDSKQRSCLTKFLSKYYFEMFAFSLYIGLSVTFMMLDHANTDHDVKVWICVGLNCFMLVVYLTLYCMLRQQLNAIKDVEL